MAAKATNGKPRKRSLGALGKGGAAKVRAAPPPVHPDTYELRARRQRGEAAVRYRYGAFGREPVPSPQQASSGYSATHKLISGGKNTPTMGLSTDGRYRIDLPRARAQSQDFDANNSLYSGLISRVCDFVLGSGSLLQVMTSDTALNAKVEALWDRFWESPEVRGMDSGPDFERKELRHALVDGDVLRLEVGGGKVQTIVADQIDGGAPIKMLEKTGATIEQGVELDSLRRPVAYHIARYTPYGYIVPSKADRIDADKCTMISFRRRMDQTRGEPVMLPAFPMVHRLNDIFDSEAAAWQLLSRLAVAINRNDAAKKAYQSSIVDDQANTSTGPLSQRVHELDSAIIFHGELGEEIRGIERNIPGANFVESVKMFLRLVGQVFGFSLEFVLLIWSDTNYSSGRASAKQVERNTAHIRGMIGRANSRTYRRKLAEWVASGELTPAEATAVEAHEFRFPPYPFIDPEKERKAQVEAVRAGFSTMTRESKVAGDDYTDLLSETAREIEMAIGAADRLNAAHPAAGVSWRDFRPINEASPATVAAKPAEPIGRAAPEGAINAAV